MTKRMRSWASDSYDPKTGKAAGEFGGKSIEGLRTAGSSQIETARAGGSGKGNPGVSAMNKSGSADPGRNKWGASTE